MAPRKKKKVGNMTRNATDDMIIDVLNTKDINVILDKLHDINTNDVYHAMLFMSATSLNELQKIINLEMETTSESVRTNLEEMETLGTKLNKALNTSMNVKSRSDNLESGKENIYQTAFRFLLEEYYMCPKNWADFQILKELVDSTANIPNIPTYDEADMTKYEIPAEEAIVLEIESENDSMDQPGNVENVSVSSETEKTIITE